MLHITTILTVILEKVTVPKYCNTIGSISVIYFN